MKFFKITKRRLWRFFIIMGPGIITACADNDAPGITTYSLVGAHFGYKMLWLIFLSTFSLAIVQEMATRLSITTGKGLSELIREEFNLKITFLAMLSLFIANLGTTIAEFAGIAASLELFGLSKYFTVPLIAFFIWWLVVKGSYKKVEKIFLFLCMIFLTYILSAILVKPDWNEVLRQTFIPHFELNSYYILILIATLGTTITPWMQFFLSATLVEKGITPREYKYSRLDTLLGVFLVNLIAYFIIVCTGTTLASHNIELQSAEQAALALKPLAGEYCSLLFGLGLFGASMLAASILPLSTAYAICEAFGWERGVDKNFSSAPIFLGLYTFLIFIGAGITLIPKLHLVPLVLFSQSINGILLPIILILMLILANNRELLKENVNNFLYNLIAYLTVLSLITLSLLWLISFCKY